MVGLAGCLSFNTEMCSNCFLLSLCLCLASNLAVSAQSAEPVGELRKRWYDTSLPDSVRFKTVESLGVHYTRSKPDSAILIGKELTAEGRRKGNREWMATGQIRIGKCYYMMGQLDSSLVVFRRGLRYTESEQDFTYMKLHSELGLLFLASGQVDSGMYYLKKCIDLVQKYNKYHKLLNTAYGNLSVAYVQQGKYLEALQCEMESIKYGNDRQKVVSATNIGNIFKMLGMRDEARASFGQAVQLAQKAQDKGDLLKAYAAQIELAPNLTVVQQLLDTGIKLIEENHLERLGIGLVAAGAQAYLDSMQISKARLYIDKTIAISDKMQDDMTKSHALLMYAMIYSTEGKYRQSLQICRKLKPLFERDGSVYQQSVLYDYMCKNFEGLHQMDSAFYYLRKKEVANEKVNNKDLIRSAVSAYLKKQTENEQKNLQLAKEKAEQTAAALQAHAQLSYWIFGSLLLLLLIFAGAYYIFYRQKTVAAARLEQVNGYLRQEQEKLQQSNQKLRQFSGIVSHDILSNLDLILSAGNVLASPEAPRENLLQYCKITQDSSRRLKDYCVGLLEEARRVRQTQAQQALHDPMPQVHAVLAQFGPALRAARFRVELAELSPAPLPAPVAEQVFHNLISNALRHGATAPEPVLRISEMKDGRSGWVVEDNGPGLTPQQMAAIFAPQAPSPTRSAGQQMGLQLLRDTLREYGADIEVSVPAGGGARFVILFTQQ